MPEHKGHKNTLRKTEIRECLNDDKLYLKYLQSGLVRQSSKGNIHGLQQKCENEMDKDLKVPRRLVTLWSVGLSPSEVPREKFTYNSKYFDCKLTVYDNNVNSQ